MPSDKHIPNGPKDQKRPADVIGNAVHVMKIAAGEIEESADAIGNAVHVMKIATVEIEESGVHTEDGKNQAAVDLGRRGGLARAKKTKKADRVRIARKAAATRWKAKR